MNWSAVYFYCFYLSFLFSLNLGYILVANKKFEHHSLKLDCVVDLDIAEEEYDPYGDMLKFDKSVKEDENVDLVSAWSIGSPKGNSSTPGITLFKPVTKEEKSLEYQLSLYGLPWKEIEDRDIVLQAKDAIEMRRGHAIWSKRSTSEIQREIKKAAQGLNIPENVAGIVRMVYLDKTKKLGELKKDVQYELDYLEFKKWISEQKKKTKKNPLPALRTEVAKRWVKEKPQNMEKIKVPPVVMDDRREPVFGVVMDASNKIGGSSAIVTSSMLYWDTDLPVKELKELPKVVPAEYPSLLRHITIDDTEIMVYADDEYFVIL